MMIEKVHAMNSIIPSVDTLSACIEYLIFQTSSSNGLFKYLPRSSIVTSSIYRSINHLSQLQEILNQKLQDINEAASPENTV